MNSIENLLCIFCRNSTIISTEKPNNYIFNKSNEEEVNKTNLYSICTLCNKYSYIQLGTLLYNEKYSKINNTLSNIKHDPKLISIDMFCEHCKKEQLFKMFADDNFDLQYKYICTVCDTFYDKIS